MMAPPPPPPPFYGGGEGMGPKPTSGKAIASLVCGLVGFLVFCYLPVIASVIGIVLGILGIIETGREGRRAGRGLAIAGTIVSTLAVGVAIAFFAVIFFLSRHAQEESRAELVPMIATDQALIIERLKKYYTANGDSLGPGGPRLVSGDATTNGNAPAAPAGSKVTGKVALEHLVEADELKFGGGRKRRRGGGNWGRWELTITGRTSATLVATDWGGNVLREVQINNIGTGDIVQVK